LQINNEVESITCRWRKNHENCKTPFQDVWGQWCPERLGRGPDAGVWEDSLTTAFSDDSRGTYDDGDDVSESAEGDEEVKGFG